jgi:hypothetical protein
MNTHYSEDDLVLFFYGEGRRRPSVQVHLDNCAQCAALYAEIATTLKLVSAPQAPERDERYGLEVWQRLRPVLPVRPPAPVAAWWMNRLVLSGAVAAMVIAAFLVGRGGLTPTRDGGQPSSVAEIEGGQTPIPSRGLTPTEAGDAADRMRTAAIADHLEQSERLLLDFVNAGGQVVDVSTEQSMAADLIDANRLYREAADGAGETMIADVLDALERSLIEIAHGPSTLSPADFNKMRMRLDAASLLFKVRVLSDELRDRDISTVKPLRKDA